MARKSVLELIAQANADFPDNATGLITPAKLRQFVTDFLNSFAPAYGYLSLVGPTGQIMQLTPTLLLFDAAYDSNPAETTSAVPASTITRSERGATSIEFNADLETNNGRFVTFILYKNGVATPWRVTGNGGGTGNPVAVSLTAMDYADPAATYDIRVSCEVAGTSVLLSNMVFLVSVEPVRSFT